MTWIKRKWLKMGKISIEVTLDSNSEVSKEKYNAIKDKNRIIYQEKECKVTILTNEFLKMKRENDDFLFEMEFIPNKETKGICHLKKENLKMDLQILTDYVIIEENIIIVKYKVLTTNQEVIYKLEV